MTVIVASRDPHTGYCKVGADRRATEEDGTISIMACPKINQTAYLIYGGSGNCAPGQLLDPILAKYKPKKDGPLLGWLRGSFLTKARRVLQEADWYWSPGAPGHRSDYDFDYLLAAPEGLYTIEETLESHEVRDEFSAVGSGRMLALGAMHAGASVGVALRAAARFDPGVAPPFDILEIPAPE